MAIKKRTNLIWMMIIIWGIILLIFSIIIFIIILNEPVSFSINLNQLEFEKGEELILSYKLSNYWFIGITNIKVESGIENKRHLFESKEYDGSKIFKSVEGEYTLDTNSLSPGTYKAIVKADYLDIHGKSDSKELTLMFKVE